MRTSSAGPPNPLGDSANFVVDLTTKHDARIQNVAAARMGLSGAQRSQMQSKQDKARLTLRNKSEARNGELALLLEPAQRAFHQDIAKRVDIATNEDRLLKVYAQQPKKFHQIEEEEEKKYA